MPDHRPENEKPFSWPALPVQWVRQYVVVFEFLGYLAIFGWIGSYLDRTRGWQPWGLFGGLMVGLVAGVYRMVREANRMNKG